MAHAGPTPYVLIVDTDADRAAVAVRESSNVLQTRVIVARDGEDANRMVAAFGAPTLLIAALPVGGRHGLAPIEAVLRVDERTPIIAWSSDRDVREYAACRLAHSRAKVLRSGTPAAVLRRCLDALLRSDDEASDAQPDSPTQRARDDETWSRLAARAQQRLQVAGAAVYAKACGQAQYRLTVVWSSEAPMPPLPEHLPAVLDQVIAGGKPLLWREPGDEPALASPGSASYETIRSMAIVPIVRNGQTAGALCAFDSEPDALRQTDLDTLTAVAGETPPNALQRRELSTPPIDRAIADVVIPRELARAHREQLSLSLILLTATLRVSSGEISRSVPLAAVGDMLARAVRGNDLVIRWTDSEVLLVLTGVEDGVARRVAERVRVVLEASAPNRIAVRGAVTELRKTESFEATVARAAERLQLAVRTGNPQIA